MNAIDIDSLTLKQVKDLKAIFSGMGLCSKEPPPQSPANHAYPTGSNVFIRTVTMHYTGKLVEVTPGELVLEEAAWVADSGRFAEALAQGTLNEVEPYPSGRVCISRGAVLDVSIWGHELPRKVK